MAESASQKIRLHYPVSVNGVEYPAGSLDVPKEQAADLERLDETRIQAELSRMRANPDNIVPVGIDPVTGQRFKN